MGSPGSEFVLFGKSSPILNFSSKMSQICLHIIIRRLSIHSEHVRYGRYDCPIFVGRSEINFMGIVTFAQKFIRFGNISLSKKSAKFQMLGHSDLKNEKKRFFIYW